MNQQDLTEQQRVVNIPRRAHGMCHNLALADGTRWEIAAGNNEAASIVSQLGDTMQLRMTEGALDPSLHGDQRRLLVQVAMPTCLADCYMPLTSKDDGVFVSILCPSAHCGGVQINLVKLSLIFVRKAQALGGFLIHGALAERNGAGVILAAPGGTGKTTASSRLPAPWRSLCDDTTLVALDKQGNYWAHPWPTWSSFDDEGAGGSWNVQNAVPLRGIFFLSRSIEDRVERVGSWQAVSRLSESVKQASMFTEQGLSKEEVRILRLEQFNNLCAFARVMPAHVLHISLTGAFWHEIEQALEKVRGDETINKKECNPA